MWSRSFLSSAPSGSSSRSTAGSGDRARGPAPRAAARRPRAGPDSARRARELDEGERLGHPAGDLRRLHALHAQAEAHVLRHGAVGEERVVLEHHADAAAGAGAPGSTVRAVDRHLPGVGRDEARHRAQGGGLAASGGAEEGEELARGYDGQRHAVERQGSAVALDEAGQRDGSAGAGRFASTHLPVPLLGPLRPLLGHLRPVEEHELVHVGRRADDLLGHVRRAP